MDDTNLPIPSQEMTHRAKVITSCSIWFCTGALGLSVNFVPASLLDFSAKYETDVSTIATFFSVLTLSFLIGAIASGVLFNFMNRQLASALLFICMGIAIILLPHAPTLILFLVLGSVIGICAGGYDTAQIVWIIEMWKEGAGIYIQIQHFCFALGTVISPLICKPFLSTAEADSEEGILEPNTSPNLTGNSRNELLLNETLNSSTTTSHKHISISPLMYMPFAIGGGVAVLGGISILLLFIFSRYQSPRKLEIGVTELSEADVTVQSSHWCSRRIILIVLSAIFLGAYQGMEACTNQFLPTFTHFIELGLSKPDGALILSGLSGAFTIGRGIGILIVLRVLPEHLLLGNLILIVLGNSALLFLSNNSLLFLWAAAITLGIGFSTVFPSFYGYIEKHLKISNFVGAVMIVAGGFVSALYPIVIGHEIQNFPFVLMFTNYFSICLATTAFITIYCITTRNKGSGYDVQGKHGSEQQNLNPNSDADMELKSKTSCIDSKSSL